MALLRAKKEGKEELSKEDFVKACKIISDSGFTPGVHDLGHNPVHCGHCKLLMADYFSGEMPELVVTPDEMIEEIGKVGGVHIYLDGEHAETKVIVNFVPNTTYEPSRHSFILDAWYGEKVGVELGDLLVNAVKTVEGLNGPRVIEVVE